jgi:MFS family permease
MGVTFMVGMLYYSALILWPLQIQTFYATTSTNIGLYGMAFSLGGCLSAPIFAFFFERFDKARWFLTGISVTGTVLAGCAATVGMLLLCC